MKNDTVKFRLGLTMKAQFEAIAEQEQRTLASLLRFALWEWLKTKSASCANTIGPEKNTIVAQNTAHSAQNAQSRASGVRETL
jgi:hypothetical protein